jgi:outer membrane lipoprotein-sorting protein
MKRIMLFILCACLIAGIAGFGVMAAAVPEFSADVKMTNAKGKVSTGKIFMEGNKIRQEMTVGKATSVSILRLDKMVSWTLLPNNQYIEMKIPFDPANPGANSDIQYDTKNIGTETVNGYACQVMQTTYKDKKYGITVQWVADKLGFAIKTQTKDAGGKVTSTMEYSNIVMGAQPASLFEIPAGYEKMALPF